MEWNNLEKEWKVIFELSWRSFCEGNLPIAAIITDTEGNILSQGRNHYNTSGRFLNPRVDHAETECVQLLDIRKYPNVHDYILYTSLEPCPMCMGTIIMGNIKKVRIAARDSWAGATNLCDQSEYMRGRRMDIQFVEHKYGNIHMTLQCYTELRYRNKDNPVLLKFKNDYPGAFEAANRLLEGKLLDHCVSENNSVENVYHLVYSELRK